MVTRTLVTLTLLLIFTAGAEPLPPAAHPDRARAARHVRVDDDLEGCREPAPSPAPIAAAACADEGRP